MNLRVGKLTLIFVLYKYTEKCIKMLDYIHRKVYYIDRMRHILI